MRHLLFALMIALLPVRGWVGNAMAVDMAAQQITVAQGEALKPKPLMHQNASPPALASMPADCPMLSQAVSDPGTDIPQDTATGTPCNDCNSCQLCLALASFSWAAPPDGSFAPHSAPLNRGTRFRSADSAFSLKPPIS